MTDLTNTGMRYDGKMQRGGIVQRRKCPHSVCDAWYNFFNSRKDWRGFYKCRQCGTIMFSELLKDYIKEND